MSDPVDKWTFFKHAYSLSLLIVCIILVMALVFNDGTKLSQDVHPAFACFSIWFGIIVLYLLEGGQFALMGLAAVPKDLYENSHPIAHEICSLVHNRDTMRRYLIGRQFLVVLTVLLIHLSSAPLEGHEIPQIPTVVNKMFLVSGLAVTFMTAILGQISAEYNATACMLDFMNTWIAWITVHVALAVEATGILHIVYLFQLFFSYLLGEKPTDIDASSGSSQAFLFWSRVAMSLMVLVFSFAVTIAALLNGNTTLWGDIPGALAVMILFFLLSVLGTLEGIPTAISALGKVPVAERAHYPMVMQTCAFLSYAGKRRVPMVGRQLCATFCLFIMARVVTPNAEGHDSVFGVSKSFQEFVNTGILGTIITASVGSILWQLFASAFPLQFLSNPLVYGLLRICALLEFIGLCLGAWALATFHQHMAKFQPDEQFIGTAEERAANRKDASFNRLDGMVPVHDFWYPKTDGEQEGGSHKNNVSDQVQEEEEGSHVFVPASAASSVLGELNLCRTPSSIHSSLPDNDMPMYGNPLHIDTGKLEIHQLYSKASRSPIVDGDEEDNRRNSRGVHLLGGNLFHHESNIFQPESETDTTRSELHLNYSSSPSSLARTSTDDTASTNEDYKQDYAPALPQILRSESSEVEVFMEYGETNSSG